MTAYYNEWDSQAAAWLRELISRGLIAAGDVDERNITDVQPEELKGYTQHHFFAGIGGWSLALRSAGWPDARPVFTGSPPCQPFSAAGRGGGYSDERHLAPQWLRLVKALRPAFVFGEQVAAAVKKDNWLDDLLDELEAENYATGAIVLPACGVGAPHIRQRLWVVARLGDREQPGLERHSRDGDRKQGWSQPTGSVAEASESGGVDDTASARHDGAEQGAESYPWGKTWMRVPSEGRGPSRLAYPNDSKRDRRSETGTGCSRLQHAADHRESSKRPSKAQTGWHETDWLCCRDGKWRPVESGTFPLANGIPARVGRLRGYGNAIVPQVAAEVIMEVMEQRG